MSHRKKYKCMVSRQYERAREPEVTFECGALGVVESSGSRWWRRRCAPRWGPRGTTPRSIKTTWAKLSNVLWNYFGKLLYRENLKTWKFSKIEKNKIWNFCDNYLEMAQVAKSAITVSALVKIFFFLAIGIKFDIFQIFSFYWFLFIIRAARVTQALVWESALSFEFFHLESKI